MTNTKDTNYTDNEIALKTYVDDITISILSDIPVNDVRNGDGTIIRMWLNNGGMYRFDDCWKLVQEAVIHGNLTMTQLLIISVGVRDVRLMSVLLHLACIYQRKDIVEWLLSKTAAQLDISNDYGSPQSATKICCETGNLEILKLLLLHEPRRLYNSFSSSQYSNNNMSFLQCRNELAVACEKGHLDLVRFLVLIRNINPVIMPRDDGHPLMAACTHGQLPVMDWLLSIYMRQNRDCTTILTDLLIRSCENVQRHISKYLLLSSLEIRINNIKTSYDGRSRYSYLWENRVEHSLIHLVISHDDNNGQTPLHKAVLDGNYDLVSNYFGQMTFSDINKQDNNGETALHLACKVKKLFDENSFNIIKLLVIFSETNLNNDDRLTPLQLAKNEHQYRSRCRDADIFEKLFDKDKCFSVTSSLAKFWLLLFRAFFHIRLLLYT